MKRYILPIFYGILILRPVFLGGTLWSNYPDAGVNVLPVITEAIAADKPVDMEVWVTAYSSAPEETDDTPFTTASNKDVQDGFIAANFLPFGTRVKIPELFNEKVFVVEDRMHRRKAGFIDIWMPTKAEALEFGIHRANVVIVEMGKTPKPLIVKIIVKNLTDKNPAQD